MSGARRGIPGGLTRAVGALTAVFPGETPTDMLLSATIGGAIVATAVGVNVATPLGPVAAGVVGGGLVFGIVDVLNVVHGRRVTGAWKRTAAATTGGLLASLGVFGATPVALGLAGGYVIGAALDALPALVMDAARGWHASGAPTAPPDGRPEGLSPENVDVEVTVNESSEPPSWDEIDSGTDGEPEIGPEGVDDSHDWFEGDDDALEPDDDVSGLG